ncbi:MAG: hypothetical protein ABIU05_19740 [Nitrospirales bacterium]
MSQKPKNSTTYPSSDGQIETCHSTARRLHWERATGEIVDPATPLFLAREGHTFVVIVEFKGDLISIHSTALRTKRHCETQRSNPPR